MTIFIVICTVLALLTLVWVVAPLFSTTAGDHTHATTPDTTPAADGQDASPSAPMLDDPRSAQNVIIFRERLAELNALHADGSVDERDYAQQKSDIEHALAMQVSLDAKPAEQGRAWGLAAVIIIALPAISIWLYMETGTPAALDPVHQIIAKQPTTRADVETMVNNLAKQMAEDPDNSQGWYRLAQSFMVLRRFPEALDAMENIQRLEGDTPQVLSMFSQSYMVMGRFDDAVTTIQKMRTLQGDTPELLLSYADAVAMQNGAQLAGEPEELIVQALSQSPNNIRALWMAGMAARQRGANAEALVHWEKLYPMLTDEPQSQAELSAMLEEIRGGNNQATTVAQATVQTAPTPSTSTETEGSAVTVNVSLDDRFRATAKPDDTVFIFARAAQGPRMPLAVHRTTVSELPLTVTLSDADAMTPQMNLSSAQNVRIVARVSKQGQPIAAPGDIEGSSQVIDATTAPKVVLVIDTVVN